MSVMMHTAEKYAYKYCKTKIEPFLYENILFFLMRPFVMISSIMDKNGWKYTGH